MSKILLLKNKNKNELIQCILEFLDTIIPTSLYNYISFFSNAKDPYYKLSNFNHIKDGILYPPPNKDIRDNPRQLKSFIDNQEGLIYPSVEHAYQAQKYIERDRIRFSINGDLGNWDGFKLIHDKDVNYWKKKDNIGIIAKMATNPKNTKKLGLKINKKFKCTIDLWLDILILKFQKEYYKNILLATNNLYLLEFDRRARLRGSEWGGIIEDRVLYGDNKMGIYIMIIRYLLQNLN